MSASKLQPGHCAVIQHKNFPLLIKTLRTSGYTVVGPTRRDGAIAYGELESAEELPAGWTDEQTPATYRLKKQSSAAVFDYTVGPDSWKKYLYPPHACLWKAQKDARKWEMAPMDTSTEPMAFLGVRACELHAITMQDKILTGGQYADSIYQERRKNALFIAVNCTQAGGTCFCASLSTGPRATFGYDLALTELIENGSHDFLVEVGSAKGAKLLKNIPISDASDKHLKTADKLMKQAAKKMGRSLNVSGLKDLLYRNYEHPRWDDVANRCLTCANCTMVCPTCFCCTVEDVTDLTGQQAERWRKWDSCFTTDFSYIHGGSIRATPKSRYRQWLTHKFATWMDQFGTLGCVGCGRCITWCPAAIDVTEELRAIRQTDGATLAKEK